MTDEPNPFSDDVMKALRENAQARAPGAARARVAARLTTVGAGVLAGAASAAASSLQATASAATLSGLALSKTFGLGLVLGVGTAVAAYSVGSLAERASVPATSTTFAGSAVVPARAARSPMARRPAAEAPAPVTMPAEAAPVNPTPVNPTPELPRSPRAFAPVASTAPAEVTRGLAEQQALLDNARSLLRTGDPAGALDAVARHDARFPRTMFQEEREALAIRALVALGRMAEARARTDAFARRYGGSLALPALHKAVERNHETVTEPSRPAQTPSEGSALR